MSNQNRDENISAAENIGALMGIAMCLIIVLIVQAAGFIDGDSDDIYMNQIQQALDVCEDNGGLHMIDGEMFKEHHFKCRNGAVFTYDEIRDRK